jgi:hypothetical protein
MMAGWIQLCYTVRTCVIVIMYSQCNNKNVTKWKENRSVKFKWFKELLYRNGKFFISLFKLPYIMIQNSGLHYDIFSHMHIKYFVFIPLLSTRICLSLPAGPFLVL